MNIGWWLFMLIGGSIFFVFFSQKIIPLFKWGWKLILQIVVGAFFLFFFNMFGQLIHVYIPLNLITALLVGILGIPGLTTLVLIKLVIIPM